VNKVYTAYLKNDANCKGGEDMTDSRRPMGKTW